MGYLIVVLEHFDTVIADLRKKKRQTHLLLGNGFSMAYDSDIFSYNALHNFIDNIDNKLLSKLFEIVNTKDFELVMQQLDNFLQLVAAFDADSQLQADIQHASDQLKTSLIDAIKALHPTHVFDVQEERSTTCAKFLRQFLDNDGHVFTTNYDILLYWILMRNGIVRSGDGFGRDWENDGEYVPEDELEFSELRWGRNVDSQTINFLHGALHIFDTGTEIVKEEYDSQNWLLEKIEARLLNKEYPVFVTAGNGREKLTHIRHNRYLSACYDNLSDIEGSLVTFGFNFGEQDSHILDAINLAAKKSKYGRLWSIYIGVFSENSRKHIEQISSRFKCKVHVFDSKTAQVWDA